MPVGTAVSQKGLEESITDNDYFLGVNLLIKLAFRKLSVLSDLSLRFEQHFLKTFPGMYFYLKTLQK